MCATSCTGPSRIRPEFSFSLRSIGRGRQRQAKSRLAISFSDLEQASENTAELCRNISEDDFSETKRCRSREKKMVVNLPRYRERHAARRL